METEYRNAVVYARYSSHRQGEQSIKQHRHNIAHCGHRSKGLVKDIGQGDKHQRGATIRADAHREGSRKNHKTRKNGNNGIDKSYLYSRLAKIGLSAEIRGIGA